MQKREIDVFDYASDILKAVKKGVLITTKAGDRINTMTISWGTLGIEWGVPMFTAFIREGRYTNELLSNSDSFTINIPVENSPRKPVGYVGVKSGRNTDKIKDMNLTLVDADIVDAPVIKEFPLVLECKIVYHQLQDKNALVKEYNDHYYPQDVSSENPGINKDYHIAYYGEIVKAYIIED